MQFEKHNFNYSMKNIPLISEKEYKPLLLDSISKFMTNLQWKANVFLHPEGFRNHPDFSTLNLRNELYGWCQHKERFLLMNT